MCCINCNNTKNLKEYYIVPLEAGGNDIPSNKVKLCNICVKNTPLSKTKKNGRPVFATLEDVEDTLSDWFNCKIGTKEAKETIGLKSNNQGTWSRLKNQYKDKYGIVDNRNNIDILTKCSYGLREDQVKGYIKYKDCIKIKLY